MALMDVTASFDPEWSPPSDWALMYRARGIQVVPAQMPAPVPAQWKRPALKDWKHLQDNQVPEATFERWYGPSGKYAKRPNMGIIAGAASGNLFVIDLDSYKTGAAMEWWRGLLAVHNNDIEPETWQQTTGGGGRQIVFRAPPGVIIPTNKTKIGVDIRGHGGFAMLPPSKHLSSKDYEWVAGCAPWEIEAADAPQWLIEGILALVAQHGGTTERPEITLSPIQQTDAFGMHIDGREDRMTKIVWAAVVDWRRECPIPPTEAESHARMEEAYRNYERNIKSRIVSDEPNSVRLEREGRGRSAFAEKWRYAMRQWENKVAEAASIEKTVESAPLPSGDLDAHPFTWTEPNLIAPRSWLYGRHYIRRFVSCTVAPGGSGKSTLELAEALSMASGKAIIGEKPVERVRVWIWNLEDPLEEIRRRIAAACIHFKLTPADLDGWLFVDSGREMPLILAEAHREGVRINTAHIEALQATIIKNQIGCLQVDPFVASHRVPENDNNAIEAVVKTYARIADQTNCAIELIHHTRKTNGEEATVDDSRGASALLAAARSARVINPMPPKIAAECGIENHRLYFSLQNGKGNMAPPPNCADWFKLTSVPLGNGRGLYPEGDKVAVVESWKFPSATAGLTGADFEKAAAMIRSGQWRKDPQCKNWVGVAIANALNLDLDKPTEKARVRGALAMWLKAGSLIEVERDDKHRHPKPHVEVADGV